MAFLGVLLLLLLVGGVRVRVGVFAGWRHFDFDVC